MRIFDAYPIEPLFACFSVHRIPAPTLSVDLLLVSIQHDYADIRGNAADFRFKNFITSV